MSHTEHKIIPWHSKPVAIISTKTEINLINADNTVFSVMTKSHDDASSDKFDLCRVARQKAIRMCMQSAVWINCQGAAPMTTETHGILVQRRCSMNVRGPTDILTGKTFYVCIANMTANPVTLPKFMIVTFVSRAPTCITHARYGELHMLKEDGLILTQCYRSNSGPTVNDT